MASVTPKMQAAMVYLEFEHNYQQKLLIQRFLANSTCTSESDVSEWRKVWTKELSSWHSPYKALIDLSELTLGADDKVLAAIERMLKFFQGFFLRKMAAFGYDETKNHGKLPFKVFLTREEAEAELGVRLPKSREAGDFRSNIVLQNFFQEHCIELSFLAQTTIENLEQVRVLREKMTNNLMQWHSKWTLIIDCSNLEIKPEYHKPMDSLLKFLKGLFMKRAVGYSPIKPPENYPFPVFRSRHKAVHDIEGEGSTRGDEAECRSRKSTP